MLAEIIHQNCCHVARPRTGQSTLHTNSRKTLDFYQARDRHTEIRYHACIDFHLQTASRKSRFSKIRHTCTKHKHQLLKAAGKQAHTRALYAINTRDWPPGNDCDAKKDVS